MNKIETSERDTWWREVPWEEIKSQIDGEISYRKFVVPISPVAKGRPRTDFASHKVYTPKKTRTYEAIVRGLLFEALGSKCFAKDVPLYLCLNFYVKRPQRLMRKKDPEGPVPHTRRPDLDNFLKSFLDGFNEHLSDDAQVFKLNATKYYAPKGKAPRVEVLVAWRRDE